MSSHNAPITRRCLGNERRCLPRASASAVLTALLAAPGLALTLAPTAAGAQDAPDTTSSLALPEISVLATRTPRPIDQIGSALTVITREDLERRQTRILSDVLREVAGVAVSRTGPTGALTQVRIRGAEGNHTLVLINGIEANDPASGREFDFANLLTSDIERIEILRGPQSALYGSEAIGGVINVITRRGEGPLTMSGGLEGGSFGTIQGGASLRSGGETYGFASSIDFLRTDGIDISGSDGENDDYINRTLNFTGHVQPLDNLRFDAAGRYTDADFSSDAQEFVFGRVVDTEINEQSTQQAYGLAQATLTLFDETWEQIAGVAVTDTDNDFTNEFGRSFSEATLTDITYQSNLYFETPDLADSGHVLTFLFEREDTNFSNVTQTDLETIDFGYVGQYQLSLFDEVFLSGSVRHDDFEGLEDFTSYRVTAAYVPEALGTRFHGSFGTGVQRPTPTEQFGFVPGTFVGNPDLVPEESTGWDIGVEQALFDDRLVLDVTYFNADLENEIISTFDEDTSQFSVDNADGRSERQGVEVSLTASPLENLDITGSYTFTDATDPDGEEEVRRAPHIASLNASYRFLENRARINVGVVYNGAQEDLEFGTETPETRVTLDAFTLVNVAGSYRLSENVELTARIENLLDERYEEVFGFNAPGIGAYAGIRIGM